MLTAVVDVSAARPVLTVVSDRRVVGVSVSSVGETAVGTATYPVHLVDSTGRTWTLVSDDGVTAVYTS